MSTALLAGDALPQKLAADAISLRRRHRQPRSLRGGGGGESERESEGDRPAALVPAGPHGLTAVNGRAVSARGHVG